jgi:hypothetical protein
MRGRLGSEMDTGRRSGLHTASCVVLLSPGGVVAGSFRGSGGPGGRRDRPLLENCTVDASIPDVQVLILDFCCIFVVCRSLEGHMVDALALGAEEGRCSLR